MRGEEEKLNCLKKVIFNAQEHMRVGDPTRIYSQYLRYALDEFRDMNFYISENARGLFRNEVIHEHVVPHKIIMGKLLSLDCPTNCDILSIIKKYYVICRITKAEDKLLSSLGLRSKMPSGWDEESGCVFARYRYAGISVSRVNLGK